MKKSGKIGRVSSVSRLRNALFSFLFKDKLAEMKEEFADHLEAINDNTNEIQANYEYLCAIEEKIEKMNERLDELSMMMRQQSGTLEQFDIAPLTKKEKEIFFALYCVEGEKGYASYHDIAKKVMMPVSLVQAYITNLVEKGIPVLKRYVNNSAHLSLNKRFREMQTKDNVVGINELISESIIKV